ncbi:ATP-binding cassette sub-family C member 5-like [Saccoglossus kowalevskii]
METIPDHNKGSEVKDVQRETLPLGDVGLLSFIYITWLSPLIKKSFKTGLIANDLWQCGKADSAEYNALRFERLWIDELEKRGREKSSLFAVFIRFIKFHISISIVSMLIFNATLFCLTVTIFHILQYIEGIETNLPYALGLCFTMLALEAVRSAVNSLNYNNSYIIGMRLRSAILVAIYKKVLRLRNLQDQTIGEIINLCANDTQRIFDAITLGVIAVTGPTRGIAMVIYSYILLGPAALIGGLIIFLSWPLQVLSGKLITKFRINTVTMTDRRVRMTNEMILSIGLIKMYAWEYLLTKKIQEIRSTEKSFLEKAGYLYSANVFINSIVQVLAVFLTFLVSVMTGNELTAATVSFKNAILENKNKEIWNSYAYGVIALFAMTGTMSAVIPLSVKYITESVIAAERMKKLLMMEEIQTYTRTPDDEYNAIELSSTNFSWKKQSESESTCQSLEESKLCSPDHQDESNATLFDINLSVKKGQLIGICGGVGSGKSSIISAILSQMQLISGSVSIDGNMAYVSQQPWIFNATFKENILFGLQFDKQLYEKCIRASCLQDDVDILPNGSETEIGERGINLSGGQKQRVSLARALYADSDIYLLDDPLSAVDTHVGQHIFNHYIMDALRGKTVLFVTHQLQYLSGCDEILVMRDGRVHESGTHQQLMTSSGHYANLIKRFHSGEVTEETNKIDISTNLNTVVSVDEYDTCAQSDSSMTLGDTSGISFCTTNDMEEVTGELMTKEEQAEGGVKLATYHAYIQYAGGYMISILTIFTMIIVTGCVAASSWWLGYWITHTTNQNTNSTHANETLSTGFITENTDRAYFAYVYTFIIAIMITFAIVECILHAKITLKASTTLHNEVFKKVFRSPMTFFDTTPSGRIINRFSKDLDEVDVHLPIYITQLITQCCILFFAFLSISLVFPWYLLAFILFSIVFIVAYLHFRHAMRDIKRLENISRSPWVSHMTATIQGASTIRAYGKQVEFCKRFADLVDCNSVPFVLFYLTNRWVAVRLDVIGMTTSFVAALMAVLAHGQIPPSYSGIALSYAVQLTGVFQFLVRMIADCEARFTSVERIQYYIKNLVSEAPVVTENRPPDNWPHAGAIEVKELKMRFRKNLPLALRGVSFKVEPMQKIGLVGRTGAGKSSLGACLFRLRELNSGAIYIDGIDIASLGLQDLRSKLTIIAQDPVLFVGTVRYNLDPFQQYSDVEVWSALEKCYMKDTVQELEDKLNAPVVENGENFSVGERQLLCMARAWLRKSKIVMLDEATASIDTATDSLIQQTIKDAFQDCTMLIIAHRLNTVLNCDKIMVMDKGKVIEFDKPSILLADTNSRFSFLMAAAEKK